MQRRNESDEECRTSACLCYSFLRLYVRALLRTHPATNLILNGITRQVLLRLCNELTIPIEEKEFTLEEAFEMDEVFLTSTTSEVMPITKIDGRIIGNGEPGPITKVCKKHFIDKFPRLLRSNFWE